MWRESDQEYLADKFLAAYLLAGVDKRLAFDVWADREGYPPHVKRELWRRIKGIGRGRRRRL